MYYDGDHIENVHFGQSNEILSLKVKINSTGEKKLENLIPFGGEFHFPSKESNSIYMQTRARTKVARISLYNRRHPLRIEIYFSLNFKMENRKIERDNNVNKRKNEEKKKQKVFSPLHCSLPF